MSEVLKLEFTYDAATESGSLLAILDAVDASGVVLLGVPQPARAFDLAKLSREHSEKVAEFRSWLRWLERVTREKADGDVLDVDRIREEAARVALERQHLAAATAAHRAELAAIKAEIEAVRTAAKEEGIK